MSILLAEINTKSPNLCLIDRMLKLCFAHGLANQRQSRGGPRALFYMLMLLHSHQADAATHNNIISGTTKAYSV